MVEYEEIDMQDGVPFKVPAGLSDEEVARLADDEWARRKRMNGKESNRFGWGDALMTGLTNIPQSAGRNIIDIIDAALSPIETAKNVGRVAAGYAQKLPFIPGTEYEQYADAMSDYFADRYGSEDAIKQSIASDPVGVLSDLSTIFTGGAGAARGIAKGAGAAAKAGGRVGVSAAKTAETAGRAADILGKGAAWTDPLHISKEGALGAVKLAYGRGVDPASKLYHSALGPTMAFGKHPKYSDDQIRAMVDYGLQNRIPVNRSGMDKAAILRAGLGQEVGEAIARAEEAGARINPDAIVGRALNSDARHKIDITDYSEGKKQLKAFDNELAGFLDEYPGGADALPTDIQERKVALGEKNSRTYANGAQDRRLPAAVEGERALRHEMMTALEEVSPEVKNLNRQIGILKDFEPELLRATTRGMNKRAIDPITGAAVSNLLGTEAGQTAAFALPFLTSPGVRSRIAFGLDALAKMDDPFRYRGIMSALYGGEQANEKVEKTKKRNGR